MDSSVPELQVLVDDSLADYLTGLLEVEDAAEVLELLMDLKKHNKWDGYAREVVNRLSIVLKGPERDVDGFISVLADMLYRIPETPTRQELFVNVCSFLVDSTLNAPMKTRCLQTILYYCKGFKIPILRIIIESAHQSKTLEIWYKYIIDEDISAWREPTADICVLLGKFHDTLLGMNKFVEAHSLLLKIMSCITPDIPNYETYARLAVQNVLKSEAIDVSCDIASIPAVKSLQQSQPNVYELLETVHNGNLDQLDTLLTAHPTLVSSLELDQAVLREKTRLLTLTNLCSSHPSLTYDEIAQAIKIPLGDVEQWVVRGVSLGLIEGKMDQLSSTLTITRTRNLRFAKADWVSLKQKVDHWKAVVNELDYPVVEAESQ